MMTILGIILLLIFTFWLALWFAMGGFVVFMGIGLIWLAKKCNIKVQS